jgi:peptidyl-prolyl cis-trans isomerase B (cyclophilin B)
MRTVKLAGLTFAVAALALIPVSGEAAPGAKKAAGNPTLEINVEKRGRIAVELFAKEAPATAAHFQRLAKSGFYNGIRFHRVRPGFMAQAGDPATIKLTAQQLQGLTDEDYPRLGIGGGGSGKNIPFETTNRTHEPGTLAMALSAPRSATADSQFFINLVPNHRLDGDYCVFARVVRGMDVVKKIQQGDRIVSIRPAVAPRRK